MWGFGGYRYEPRIHLPSNFYHQGPSSWVARVKYPLLMNKFFSRIGRKMANVLGPRHWSQGLGGTSMQWGVVNGALCSATASPK